MKKYILIAGVNGAGKIAVRKISQYFSEEKTFNHRESPCHIVGKFKLGGAFIAPFNYIIATQWGGKSLLCVNMLY